jgi:hypothetical protein
MPRNVLIAYFAATALFAALDFGFGINVRVAFFEAAPGLRVVYYAFCFLCLAVMFWRPAWTEVVSGIESVFALGALIVTMGIRVMVVTDDMLESGTGFVTMPEIANFMIAGGAAYLSCLRGLQALAGRPRQQ